MAQDRRSTGRPALWVVLALLVVGTLLFVRSGRTMRGNGEGAQEAQGGEPTVVVVAEDGSREEMPMEKYIQGVVAGEMGRLPVRGSDEEADWPVEAYAAQAILARSFTMHYLEDRGGNEISAEHRTAQAYNPDNIIRVIEEGVEMTRGEVMMHGDDYVQALFHSYSGGQTALPSEGLQRDDAPYFKSVAPGKNEYAPEDVTDWTFSMPLAEVTRALKEADSGGVDVGDVREVRIAERGPTRRVTRFEIVGSDGSAAMGGNDFRLALGAEEFKSTLIEDIKVEGARLVASGTGFGHGVGLSQWDAYMMAREGRKPEEIVEFFFSDVEIRKLWD